MQALWTLRHKFYFLLGLLIAPKILFAANLSIDEYLSQVKTRNLSVQGNLTSAKASEEKSKEAGLHLAPTLFASAQVAADGKLPTMPFFTYSQINTHIYTLGVSQQTRFGAQFRAFYELDYTSFLNGSLGGVPPTFPMAFYDAAPKLEMSIPLLANGFGRSVRASETAMEAQSLSQSHLSRFQARNILTQAEAAYWRLAIARRAVEIGKKALAQAGRLHQWTSNRANVHLGEASDELQTQAALELRKLELTGSEDDERAAARAFNMLRNLESPEVPEELIVVDNETLSNFLPPARSEARDDVLAAKEIRRATQAAAQLTEEKARPSLDLFGSLALNGRGPDIGDTLSNSYNANRPTRAIGVKFSLPLDLTGLDALDRAAIKERDSAEMLYQQKVFEQERSWEDLTQRFEDAKRKMKLIESIEKVQETKLSNERARFKNGRTTTYQVLLFEQDYLQAQLTRLRAQAELLGVVAQMKLFSKEAL